MGLVALIPTAVLLALGALQPAQAAVRAVATLVGVMAIGRLAAWWMRAIAGRLEQRQDAQASTAAHPLRRSSDVSPSRSSTGNDQQLAPERP